MIGVGTTIFLVRPQVFASGTSYIVDDYSPLIAHSTRKLSSTATNCLRVRRTSDNAEQDIGFSGDDLDTASINTFCSGTTGRVTKWYNQGTGGATYDAAMATASRQPTIYESGAVTTLNSVNAIKFVSASNTVLETGAVSSTINGYPFSVFTVANEETSSGFGSVVGSRESSGSLEGWGLTSRRDGAVNAFYVDEGATLTGLDYLATDNTNSQRLQTTTITSGGGGELFLNGTSQDTATFAECVPTTNSPYYIGNLWTSSGVALNGYIQEVIFFSSDENSNRAAIETNINDYYSIY